MGDWFDDADEDGDEAEACEECGGPVGETGTWLDDGDTYYCPDCLETESEFDLEGTDDEDSDQVE